jgi:S1-C subfamily serine protease
MLLQSLDLTGLLAQALPAVVAVQDGGRGLGTGFLWKTDGLILTNSHVARKKKMEVTFADGRVETAVLLARDKDIDLALLRIPPTGIQPLRPAEFSGLRPGQITIAVGHPFGQRNHLTFGILSAIGQAELNGKREQIPVLRTDLALLPGNSGGPLLDAGGRVLGVNTLVVGGDQGYAVPVHLAERLEARLVGAIASERI